MICLAKPPSSDCHAGATCTVTPVPPCPCCEHDAPQLYGVYIGGVQIGLVDAETVAELLAQLRVKRPP